MVGIGPEGLDYIEIGPTPCDESCQQVGTPGYDAAKARAECERFINAIRKVVGVEPTGAKLKVKSNPHDFGSYYEVVCMYDERLPDAVAYALNAESNAPTKWPEGV